MNTLTTKQDFKSLNHGARLYVIANHDIKSYNYAGFNPKASNYILLISTASVRIVDQINIDHLGKTNPKTFIVIDYNDAKVLYLQQALKEITIIEEIYFKDEPEKIAKIKSEVKFQ